MAVGQQTHRQVPLSDTWYVSQLQRMVATLKISLERRNKQTGRTEKAREVTDRTGSTWIGEAVAAAVLVVWGALSCVNATYVPPFLCDAHAVFRYTTEGPAEPDGT